MTSAPLFEYSEPGGQAPQVCFTVNNTLAYCGDMSYRMQLTKERDEVTCGQCKEILAALTNRHAKQWVPLVGHSSVEVIPSQLAGLPVILTPDKFMHIEPIGEVISGDNITLRCEGFNKNIAQAPDDALAHLPVFESANPLETKAREWIAANPKAMRFIENFALNRMKQNKGFSIAYIWEVLRWNYSGMIEQTAADASEGYKVSNNHKAYVTRYLLQKYPAMCKYLQRKNTKQERGEQYA